MMNDVENYRRIPPPVADYTVRVRFTPPVRRSKALDYVKTDKPFMVELLFNSDIDLALFERFILDSPIRMAEYAVNEQDTSRIFVIDSRFRNDATINDIWEWTKEELPRLQAAMSIECSTYHPAKCRCVLQLGPGNRVGAVPPPVTMKVAGTDSAPAIRAILGSSTDFLNPYIQKCDGDSDFKEAMMYCGQALGFEGANQWANLYRTYEVVKDRFGGDYGITSTMAFCSKNELERFKRTVNHQESIGAFSRHARLNCEPPPNPMPFDTAVRFVAELMASWLHSGK